MNNERKQQQIANNRKILDSIRNGDGNRGHIFSRAWKRMQAMKLVSTFLKRSRQESQKAESNIELYLDDWAFHHGTPITKGNMDEAMTDCVDRMVSLHQVKQQAAEESELRTMEGTLGDGFDGGTFEELPGENEVRRSVEKYNREHGL
jgi:hypothetical protein